MTQPSPTPRPQSADEPQAEPTASPLRRRMWPWVAAAAVVAAGVAAALVIVLTGDEEHVVDESAWRQAREAQGTEFTDWRKYADVWLGDLCNKDMDMFLAMRIDNGTPVEQLRTDIRFACPNRLVDLEEFVAFLGDPCAGMDAEARSRFEEASRSSC